MRVQQENGWQHILLLRWLLEKGLALGKCLRLHPDGLRWAVREMMLLLGASDPASPRARQEGEMCSLLEPKPLAQ